jgi:aryl-alcohol dehydrogenase-like predicted oxidoreductase
MTGVGPLYLFDKKTILSNLDESLRLMKTDHIDVWQLHGVIPDFLPGGALGEAMEAMKEAKAAGKVLHLGLTIRNGQPMDYGYPATFGYNSLPTFSAWEDIEVVQLVYGALTRLSENAIQTAYDRHGTAIVARGAIKKYDERYDARFEASKISELFEEDESRNDFLIRYALTHPAIASVVIGSKNIHHVAENVKAAERGKLSAEIYMEAKKRLDYAGIVAGKSW